MNEKCYSWSASSQESGPLCRGLYWTTSVGFSLRLCEVGFSHLSDEKTEAEVM